MSMWNSWIIVTSRPSDKLHDIRRYIDAEARILGFTEKNVLNYVSRFLQNKEEGSKLVAKAKLKNMVDILKIPIMLQMICALYVSNQKLLKSKTEIIESIFDFCFERAQRKTGAMWSREQRDDMMLK